MPIRSDNVRADGPAFYSRGVRWADSDFPGYCRLVAHNDDGVLVLEQRVPLTCQDDETFELAWKWLDRHFPERRTAPAKRPAEPSSYPTLRLI